MNCNCKYNFLYLSSSKSIEKDLNKSPCLSIVAAIIPACARTGKGLTEGFEWLGETLGRIEASKSAVEPVNEAVYYIHDEKIQTGYRYVTDSFRAVARWFCGRRPTIVHV